ncbi:MAG: DUF6514 family protein [Oscillospiraceae bacterium]|nr:DUF6514 family protein [Oscillospiraceae bacterium]
MDDSKTYYGGIFLGKEELESNNIKNKVELEYYSIKKSNKLEEEGVSYGIEIVKKEYDKSRIDVETKLIENVCNDGARINEIIDVLKRNTVTPNGLDDTMEDLMKKR